MKTKNIIISGTNFWNPGDDFVRDGVIEILKTYYKGFSLNFLFYNFNQDFFPQDKFSGIHNMVAKGDLDKCARFIDLVVIAGLSAGMEIKDLYYWIIRSNLQDRVIMIGAGYENSYVDFHVNQEPEAIIFRNAKLITGRTQKTPNFFSRHHLRYYHINCPSILSVKHVKKVSQNEKISKIGFSIQIPDEIGIMNQATSNSMYCLALDILIMLAKTYNVEIVAHHKSEYFHFLKLLEKLKINVLFSSFYQDLHDIYSKYDLVVSTRLHSCLFANGFGIPSLIINDTARHTHTAEGFPHSTCVYSMQTFLHEFEKLKRANLQKLATDTALFKSALMRRYVEVFRTALKSESSFEKAAKTGNECDAFSDTQKSDADPLNSQQRFPIHFFTIVLNGKPFIEYHIKVFEKLKFPWHWHIIEGVAALKHDTAWPLQFGGRIDSDLHIDGCSIDGTSKYINELATKYPENISVYRKPRGEFWDGKLEMVSAPLDNMASEHHCLLWQVDADELWTTEQITTAREMFLAEPGRTAAFYLAHYFVGEDLVTTSINSYGNNTSYEWIRTWRFQKGLFWESHEPPRLCQKDEQGRSINVAQIRPFLHEDTRGKGLIFQHYAYADERQLKFKEVYYGYRNAVTQWQNLSRQKCFPVKLREYFDWVSDGTTVDKIETQNIIPLASKGNDDNWTFKYSTSHINRKSTIITSAKRDLLFVRTDSIGDTILSSFMLGPISRKYGAKIDILCQDFIKELYELCPHVGEVLCFARARAIKDSAYRKSLVFELKQRAYDVCISPVYSRDPLTDLFTFGPEPNKSIGFRGNAENISEELHSDTNTFFSQLVDTVGPWQPELQKNRAFLEALGINARDEMPEVWLGGEDESFAEQFFERNQLAPEQAIGLFTSSRLGFKIYSGYGEALKEALAGIPATLVAFGTKSEFDLNQAQIGESGLRGINTCGQLTLRQTGALIKRCKMVVGADTGTAHLACAVATPNVILLGGGHFGRFLPYSPKTSVVSLPLECFGCNWKCRFPVAHCVRDVSSRIFAKAIRRSLDSTSEKPRIFIQPRESWNPKNGPAWKSLGDRIDSNSIDLIEISG